MPDDPYRNDILTWSRQQADLLRRVRDGERVNDVDWDNIIEEIESLGRSELESVRSLLAQSVLHLLKLQAWPESSAARKWRHEAADFLVQAQEQYRPSMLQRMDLDGVLAYAMRRFAVLDYPAQAQPVPTPRAIPIEAVARQGYSLTELDEALFPRP